MTKDEMKNVRVICPYYHYIERGCELSLNALEQLGFEVIRSGGWSAIDAARNTLVMAAIVAGKRGIFWIDSDIGFDPRDVEKLLDADKEWICGVYPKKNSLEFAATLPKGDDWRSIQWGKEGAIYRFRWAGMGFMYTDMKLFEKIGKGLPLQPALMMPAGSIVPFFAPGTWIEDGQLVYLCEDNAFCARGESVGAELYCDTTVTLDHIGPYGFTWRDVLVRWDLDAKGYAEINPEHVSGAILACGRREPPYVWMPGKNEP